MAAVDKAALLAGRGIGAQKVEIPNVGEVEVRGLSRAEALSVQKAGAVDAAEMEARLVAMAMVNPELTLDEVRQWQKVAPAADLAPIVTAILELSGMEMTAMKEEMQRFRG